MLCLKKQLLKPIGLLERFVLTYRQLCGSMTSDLRTKYPRTSDLRTKYIMDKMCQTKCRNVPLPDTGNRSKVDIYHGAYTLILLCQISST